MRRRDGSGQRAEEFNRDRDRERDMAYDYWERAGWKGWEQCVLRRTMSLIRPSHLLCPNAASSMTGSVHADFTLHIYNTRRPIFTYYNITAEDGVNANQFRQ